MRGKPVWSASEGQPAAERQMNAAYELVRGSGSKSLGRPQLRSYFDHMNSDA